MFVSIQIGGRLSGDYKSSDYSRRLYTLVDDEFGSISGVCANAGEGTFLGLGTGPTVGIVAIITEYSKRKLNVEGNLLKYLMQLCLKCDMKMTKLLSNYDQACLDPRFAEFADLWKTVDQERILKLAMFS